MKYLELGQEMTGSWPSLSGKLYVGWCKNLGICVVVVVVSVKSVLGQCGVLNE